MSTLKKLTAAIALTTLGATGAAYAQTANQTDTSNRAPQTHQTQQGTTGHSLTGHGATGEMGSQGAGATGSASNMQHGATGRQAEGGHAIEEEAGPNQGRTGPGAGAVGRQDAPGTMGDGPRGEQGTTGTPGGAGSGAATGAGAGAATGTTSGTGGNTSGANSAPGHSSMQQGGMDNPARTADRPGVTGAPSEVERNQRDLPASGSNTQSN